MQRATRPNLAYRAVSPRLTAEREERTLETSQAEPPPEPAPWLRIATYAFLIVSCALFWWAMIAAFIQVL